MDLDRVPGEEAVKYPRKTHQKRLVRMARASVHSMAAQAGSTTWTEAGRAASARRVVPVGAETQLLRAPPGQERVQRQDHERDERGERSSTRPASPRAP